MRAASAFLVALVAGCGSPDDPPSVSDPSVSDPSVSVSETMLDVGSSRVRVLASGPTDAVSVPAVLLLHGQRFGADTWRETGTLAFLAGRGVRAVAVDLPGHGRSSGAPEPERFVGSLVRALGLERPVVVAPSMSGAWALPWIAAEPAACGGLVGVAPVATERWADALAGCAVPALFVWGADDDVLPRERGERLARRMADAELVVLENAGHACYLDRPDAFHAALGAFLDRLALQRSPAPGSASDG